MSDALELDPDFDYDARQLCPDGGCTGLIGDDGRCKVCGALGEAPPAHRSDAATDSIGRAAASVADVGASIAHAGSSVAHANRAAPDWRGGTGEGGGDDSSDEFDARQLCPDGNCTGLIGADGRCKVCGKSS